MIAARLAGGNLFLPFWVEDFGSTRSSSEHSDFLRGFCGGDFWEHSEHLDFFEGICGGGDSFFWGWWGVFWIESVGKN